MEVVNKSYWEMVEERCSAIEGTDLESLAEGDNTVSDGRYRCQMRQFVHRAVSAAPTEEEKKLIMVEVEPTCVCPHRCKMKQKLKRVFGNGMCLKSWSVQNRVRGQAKMASHPLQVAPVSALVPEQSGWREYADEGRELDGWSESFASHT